MTIETRHEATRGCGNRVPGGLYLVSGQLSEPCPRLPMELDRCPHCGQGVGPARGWTWITPAILFPAMRHGSYDHNERCPLGANLDESVPNQPHRTGERAGLIWVGAKFYPTPADFMLEAAKMGVSRRIKAVPRGFEMGKDWVYLAHRKGFDHSSYFDPSGETPAGVFTVSTISNDATRIWPGGSDDRYSPGVITLFKPTAIEYIVKGTETDEEIEAIEERGITPVKVINDVEA